MQSATKWASTLACMLGSSPANLLGRLDCLGVDRNAERDMVLRLGVDFGVLQWTKRDFKHPSDLALVPRHHDCFVATLQAKNEV